MVAHTYAHLGQRGKVGSQVLQQELQPTPNEGSYILRVTGALGRHHAPRYPFPPCCIYFAPRQQFHLPRHLFASKIKASTKFLEVGVWQTRSRVLIIDNIIFHSFPRSMSQVPPVVRCRQTIRPKRQLLALALHRKSSWCFAASNLRFREFGVQDKKTSGWWVVRGELRRNGVAWWYGANEPIAIEVLSETNAASSGMIWDRGATWNSCWRAGTREGVSFKKRRSLLEKLDKWSEPLALVDFTSPHPIRPWSTGHFTNR
jgi:hypothetical protein